MTVNTFYKNADIHYGFYSGTLVSGQVVGKLKSVEVLEGTTILHGAEYSYDSIGRLSGILSYTTGLSDISNSYTYESGTSYIQSRETNGIIRENRTRLNNTFLTRKIETEWTSGSSPNIATFDYLFDDGFRKTREFKYGQIFDSYQASDYGIVRKYAYDQLGQLIAAEDYINTSLSTPLNSSNGINQVRGRYWTWAFDNQGNRNSPNGEVRGDFADPQASFLVNSAYSSNGNNQISSRSIPDYVDLGGFYSPPTDVEVAYLQFVPTFNQHDFYWGAAAPGNSNGPVDGLVIAEDTVTNQIINSKKFALSDDTETPVYDNDGNMTQDGLWWYSYDPENRLIQMDSKTSVAQHNPGGVSIYFKYDYLGRRSEKSVWYRTTSFTGWQFGYTQRYIYNGWNVIAILHEQDLDGDSMGYSEHYTTSYTWGPDLSGSVHGAGGIGGLVSIQEKRLGVSGNYSIAQDGNGNISAVIDLSAQSVVAEMEYSPYGELVRSAGSYLNFMPFRFSTKFFDDYSDLYYYGYRYFNSETGRFINRDPIGESGGQNLYAFAGNDPVNSNDLLGLEVYFYDSFTLNNDPIANFTSNIIVASQKSGISVTTGFSANGTYGIGIQFGYGSRATNHGRIYYQPSSSVPLLNRDSLVSVDGSDPQPLIQLLYKYKQSFSGFLTEAQQQLLTTYGSLVDGYNPNPPKSNPQTNPNPETGPESQHEPEPAQGKNGKLPFGLDCAGIKAALAANNVVGAVGGFFLDFLGIDEGAASASFSVDGLFGIPLAKNMLGKGISVDVAVTASINWRDPLNFAVSLQDSVSVLDTFGIGGFVTAGPAVGSSSMPDQGFSESLYDTGRAAVGFGGAASASLDIFGDSLTGEITGSSGFAGGGLGFGFGALSGVSDTSPEMETPSYSFSTGSLNGKAALEAYYMENCE